jgi:hypothetical protein
VGKIGEEISGQVTFFHDTKQKGKSVLLKKIGDLGSNLRSI